MASKTVSAEVECEFEVKCEFCGKSLNAEFGRFEYLEVEPCKSCIDDAVKDAT